MLIDEELRLTGEAIAVRHARQFVREVLRDAPAELVDDAELTASELVTNAVLHTESDVRIRLQASESRVRIEVYDESGANPLPTRAGDAATTGRGLVLVGSLANSWGVEGDGVGKFIWCELGRTDESESAPVAPATPATPPAPEAPTGLDYDRGGPPPDTTDQAARTASTPPRDGLVDIELGEVPTALLVTAKEYLDNLVRELELAELGAAAGLTHAMPADMLELIDSVLGQFADVRRGLKEQAVRATNEGRERVWLRLQVPVQAADAAETYLLALEHADAFARASRLLTLATPPKHRAFRRWYVDSLVRHLRSIERGEPPEPTRPFEQHLLDELDAVSTAQQAAETLAVRLGHLQELTAALTDAVDVGDTAEVFVNHATVAFGATFASVYELSGDRLRLLRSRGISTDRLAGWETIPLDAEVPACVAVREMRVVAVPHGPEMFDRFPTLPYSLVEHRSIMCAPMRAGDRTLGVIALTLDEHRDVTDPQEVAFLASLADACAQALDRARALAAERRTTDKLEVLAAVSAELVSSLDYRTTLSNITELLVPRFADWCAIRTVADGVYDNFAVTHVDPDRVQVAERLHRIHNDPNASEGGALVIRTGTPVFYRVVTDDMLERSARDPEDLELLRSLGVASIIIVPLLSDGRGFGALTIAYGESGRRYEEEDLTFAEDLAHRTALAVDQAQRYQRQTGRLAAITRIAEAAQHAILAQVPERVGPLQLAGSYVSAASEALIGGDMYEVVPITGGVRLLVGDVRGKGLDAVRLATVVLGFFRSAAAEPISLAGLAWQMDRRLTPYLDDEDFVTAVMVEIDSAGHCQVVSCGHPFPLLYERTGMREIECPITLPLGLNAQPRTVHLDLSPGDRLLLYTDGLVEARNVEGVFADLMDVASPLRDGDLRSGLDGVLSKLRSATRVDLDDDLSLLAAAYLPDTATG